jgi:hypothetical protein
MTFPAVTILFNLPPENITDDPWEYIMNAYQAKFKTDSTYMKGVPCDSVGYSNGILEAAALHRKAYHIYGKY